MKSSHELERLFISLTCFSVRITAGALPRGLHVLNLSKNSISSIEGLRELTRLRVLDLSYNRIFRIGHGMSNALCLMVVAFPFSPVFAFNCPIRRYLITSNIVMIHFLLLKVWHLVPP